MTQYLKHMPFISLTIYRSITHSCVLSYQYRFKTCYISHYVRTMCNCKSLKYFNPRKCNSIGVCRIWVGGQYFFYYFWHSAYTSSGESRDLFRGTVRRHVPPKMLKKYCNLVHLKVYFNQISR